MHFFRSEFIHLSLSNSSVTLWISYLYLVQISDRLSGLPFLWRNIRGSATRGTGGRVPPFFRVRGIIPPFQENSGPNPLSFRFLVWVTL